MVWQVSEDDAIAALFCEDANDIVVRTDNGEEMSALFTVTHANGLPWLQPTESLDIDMADDWEIRLDRRDQLTIDWPAPTR